MKTKRGSCCKKKRGSCCRRRRGVTWCAASGRRSAGLLGYKYLLNGCLSIVEGRWLRTTDLQGSRRHYADNILVIVLLWK
jgi:hypothetical protein